MQVFPSPIHPSRGRYSAPSRTYMRISCPSVQSLDHSLDLEEFSNSCNTSFSDQLVYTTSTGMFPVIKLTYQYFNYLIIAVSKRSSSRLLNVEGTENTINNNSNGSVNDDSGLSFEQFSESPSSEPKSISVSDMAFQIGNFYFKIIITKLR